MQRRRQKLVEIAPAPWLDDDVRARLHAAATALIAAVPYRGLATVEFLVPASGSRSSRSTRESRWSTR